MKIRFEVRIAVEVAFRLKRIIKCYVMNVSGAVYDNKQCHSERQFVTVKHVKGTEIKVKR
jgi:hypothetical protein